MSNASGDKPRSERFMDSLVEELRSMNDTEALEGEDIEELVKLGERMLKAAREDAGKQRLASAKRNLAIHSQQTPRAAPASVAEARSYLASHTSLTLAARKLDELSDADLLDLYTQARTLEDELERDAEGDVE